MSVLSRLPIAKALFAEVLFESPAVRGQYSKSSLSWRVKRDASGTLYLGIRMFPDGGAGEGGGAQYINFDLENAGRVREGLDAALAYLREQTARSR